MVHGVLKDELAVFTAAQQGREQEYLQAKEAAEAAAKLAMSSDQTGAEQYQQLNTQVGQSVVAVVNPEVYALVCTNPLKTRQKLPSSTS